MKWQRTTPITKDEAKNEPLDQQLFGPSYDRHQRQIRARARSSGINRASYKPWSKPKIERVK